MDIDKERAAFEADMHKHGFWDADMARESDGIGYRHKHVRDMWTGWQAGRAALASQDTAPDVASLIEEIRAAKSMARRDSLVEQLIEALEARTAPPAAVPAPDDGTVRVCEKDANSYCRILSLLGMEEEGDPVAEVARLVVAAAAPAQANAWEQAVKDACTVAGELGWNEADPRASLSKLIEWHIQVALDPRVSDRAPAQAVDALGIKTWQERAAELSELPSAKQSYELLQGEIDDLRAALAAQPAAPAPTQCDEWPTDAATATGHLAGLAFGAAPADEIGHCVALIAAKIDAPAGEPVATWKCAGCGSSSADACIGVGCGMCEAEPDAAPVANAGQAQQPKVITRDNAKQAMEEWLWDFIETAGNFPEISPDDRIWGHALAYMPERVSLPDFVLERRGLVKAGQAQAVAVPGWRLVPVKQTDEMAAAAGGLSDRQWSDLLAAAPLPQQVAQTAKFQIGANVRKTKGSRWQGHIVGTYSTALTPEGYAVESSTEHGSVQIYPAAALELADSEKLFQQAMGGNSKAALEYLANYVEKPLEKGSSIQRTSASIYDSLPPDQKARLNHDLDELGKRINEHRKSRDRRTHDEPVQFDRRHGDRRHFERHDSED